MSSPTQRLLDPDQVRRYVAASLGPDVAVTDCAPLAGGGFAAVWSATLDDGRGVVLKVGPPPEVPLLRYERGLIAAEARYLRLVAARAPEVPVPPLLHHGSDPVLGDWLLTGLLAGRTLYRLTVDGAPVDAVRAQLGAALAALHRVDGDRYGYDGGRAVGATWREAFTAMVDDLLADAADWAVPLPVPAGRIRELVHRHAAALDAVRRPALLHFDGWAGNVLAVAGPDGVPRLNGLVDGERHLYGDPLLDLVSPLIFRRAEDEPADAFLRGYRAAGGPVPLDEAGVRRRLGLYRLHLYLLMTVEMPSRGITADNDPGRVARLAELLDRELAALAEP
ncbi:phosphotransferase family protein [Micromonospora purpureochromogenes]|uniref:Aminoglycoside phosphotransferase (APT) family kinase protein n=1 Tax=Micromonospora purpureochromogenes TaxID=47872 RepID=A0ABX2RVA7_9ACTN|nr:aminoglycoside phosphotransferase family protein [Micromonospora purpureochromogenes]NYF59158.1 aminoglycoside phosphotransferase (APT) family kinase protein [Micromonospora purpureochromogenes]